MKITTFIDLFIMFIMFMWGVLIAESYYQINTKIGPLYYFKDSMVSAILLHNRWFLSMNDLIFIAVCIIVTSVLKVSSATLKVAYKMFCVHEYYTKKIQR